MLSNISRQIARNLNVQQKKLVSKPLFQLERSFVPSKLGKCQTTNSLRGKNSLN